MTSRRPTILIAGVFAFALARAQGQTWLEEELAIENLAEAGEYDAALEREEPYLAAITTAFGESSIEFAEAERLIASLYTATGDYFEAENRLLGALDLYASIDGPLSTRMIDPFEQLGRNYQLAGDHELALGAFNEARSLGRRAWGLFNPAQVPVVRSMSDSVLALDRYEEARALRREALDLFLREHGLESPESLEANYRYADWLSRQGDARAADSQYALIASLIETQFGGDPSLMVTHLRLDADNKRRYRLTASDTPGHPNELEEALELLETLDDPDPRLRAEILLELGDLHTVFERTWLLEDAYGAAWRALEPVENADELREDWFGEAAVVYLARFDSRHASEEEDAPWGHVVATFTVDAEGRAGDVEFIESNPSGRLDAAVRRQILDSRYRPRMVDGRLVESTTSGRWEFQYKPD